MSVVHTQTNAQLTVGPHALVVRGLHKAFHAGIPGCAAHADVLRGIDLTVRRGEIVGIAGGVGAGKSTLLLCAAGLLRPDAGTVTVHGHPTPGPLVAYVALDATQQQPQIGSPTQALARALSSGAPVLLLDGLITLLSPGACKLIGELASRGMTVIVAERDRACLEPLVERTLVLYEGALVTPPGVRPPPIPLSPRAAASRRADRVAPPERNASPARVAEPAPPGVAPCRA